MIRIHLGEFGEGTRGNLGIAAFGRLPEERESLIALAVRLQGAGEALAIGIVRGIAIMPRSIETARRSGASASALFPICKRKFPRSAAARATFAPSGPDCRSLSASALA